MINTKMKFIYIFLIITFVSCGPNSDITFNPFASVTQSNSDEPADEGPQTLIISGTFPLADGNNSDAVNGKIFCIAQGEELSSCTAEIDDATGEFACEGILVDSPVTCFLRNADNDTTLATIEFAEDDNVTYPSYASRSALSLSLSSSVNLGDLTYAVGAPIIETSNFFETNQNNITQASNDFDFNDLTQKKWRMTCVSTGDSVLDQNCVDNLECTEGCSDIKDTFYIETISLLLNTSSLTAAGVWTNNDYYLSCSSDVSVPKGGTDINPLMQSELEDDDFTIGEDAAIYQFSSGPHCEKEDFVTATEVSPGSLLNFKAFKVPHLSGYGSNIYFKDSWSYDIFGECIVNYYYNLGIYKKGQNLYGSIYVKKEEIGGESNCIYPINPNEQSYIFSLTEELID